MASIDALAEAAARITAILDRQHADGDRFRGAVGTLVLRRQLRPDRGGNPERAVAGFAAAAQSLSPGSPARGRALLMAAAFAQFEPQRCGLVLPESVLALYPRVLQTCAETLERDLDAAYPSDSDDAFVKDARLALGFSIPAGAQAVDLDDAVRFRSLVKNALTTRKFAPLGRLWRNALFERWYTIHTDSRDLQDFNEDGWTACYHRIGEIFAADPSAGGIVGSSWFFDPALDEISPRLAYLRLIPLDGGAVMIRNGPSPIHTQRATATSATRRQLVADGKYTPVGYTILWPRQQLLEWTRT